MARDPRASQREDEGYHSRRRPMFRRKVCRFCADKSIKMDYKDTRLLMQFLTDRGKITPRRITGTCARHQRGLAHAIRRARIVALLPYTTAKS